MEQKSDERAINRLISEIEKLTLEKVNDVIRAAELKAEEIISAAKKTAEDIISAEKEKTQKLVLTKKQRAEATTKIELKKAQLEFKKEFADRVFEKVQEMAINFRADPEYRNFLKNAVLESIEVIDTPEVVIKFSSLDSGYFNQDFEKEVLEICKKDLKKTVSILFIKSDFKDIGIIGMSGDGFIMYDNTFSARMKRLFDEIYSELLGEAING